MHRCGMVVVAVLESGHGANAMSSRRKIPIELSGIHTVLRTDEYIIATGCRSAGNHPASLDSGPCRMCTPQALRIW
jgi:hypothetical protein